MARSGAPLDPHRRTTTLGAVGFPPLTRRRALALGAAAGASSLLARATPPAWARRAAPRGFGLDVARSAFGEDGRTGVLRAPRRFDLLGVRGPGLGQAGLDVRVRRRGGRWSPWVPIGPGHDHRPDTGTGAHASDPVWAGRVDELQLRCRRVPAGALRVHFVAVSALARRRGAKASAAARGRAAQGGPPAIIPRSAWGGDSVKPREAPAYGDVQVAFVHHTVTANDYGPEDSPGIVLAMAKYHRDTNGWNDLGYNFVVDKYGQIFEGRAGGIDQAVIGAQAQGYNSHSTGVANIGTYSSVPNTAAALDAMARLIAWKLPLHGAPVTGQTVLVSEGGSLNRYKSGTPVTLDRICGHRDGDATSCPGDALHAQLPELRRRTAAIAPPPSDAIRATVTPLPATVAYGAELAVAGTVTRGDGTPVAGQVVEVQKRGTTRWVTLARATTAADGTWSAEVTWKKAGKVRARVAVPGAAVVGTTPVTVGCTAALRAAVRTRHIRSGGTVTVSGTVRPLATVSVIVERRVRRGRYRRVGVVTVRPRRSRFSTRIALRRPGLYRLTPTTGRGTAAASASALFVRALRPPSGGVAADV
jgi:hypothetical protein